MKLTKDQTNRALEAWEAADAEWPIRETRAWGQPAWSLERHSPRSSTGAADARTTKNFYRFDGPLGLGQVKAKKCRLIIAEIFDAIEVPTSGTGSGPIIDIIRSAKRDSNITITVTYSEDGARIHMQREAHVRKKLVAAIEIETAKFDIVAETIKRQIKVFNSERDKEYPELSS